MQVGIIQVIGRGCEELGGGLYKKKGMRVTRKNKKIGDYLSGAAARTGSLKNVSIKKGKKREHRRFV